MNSHTGKSHVSEQEQGPDTLTQVHCGHMRSNRIPVRPSPPRVLADFLRRQKKICLRFPVDLVNFYYHWTIFNRVPAYDSIKMHTLIKKNCPSICFRRCEKCYTAYYTTPQHMRATRPGTRWTAKCFCVGLIAMSASQRGWSLTYYEIQVLYPFSVPRLKNTLRLRHGNPISR